MTINLPRTLAMGGTLLLLGSFGMSTRLRADEGMWLFNDLPREMLKSAHGFDPTEEWARNIMLASVRFNSGGSASFVSSTGLVITNHHVASDTLYKISTAEHNYLEDGFWARTPADEVRAPDLELNQLVSIDDVTDRVNEAVPASLKPAEAFKARQAAMAKIEGESLKATGLRSDVVTLFGGARYHLYRYKKYTDVRVVWAPEAAIAFFGGDPDNFEFPRYNLDVSIFRVYEQGKPAKVDQFLRWSKNGPADGELVFVSGNPGNTQRQFTTAALKYLRDHRLPYVLDTLRRREIMLQQFGFEGEEQERRAHDDLFSVQNSRKAYTGMLQGLQNPAFIQQKERSEKKTLEQIQADPKLSSFAQAWSAIAEAQKRRTALVGQSAILASTPFSVAQTLVLMAAEDQKPSPERLREFRDSNRESLEQELYSPAPVYSDFERAKLADALAQFVEKRGGDSPLVQSVLAGKSPKERAAELIAGTQLADPEERRRVAAGGQAAVEQSTDPLIGLARTLDADFRRIRQETDELDEIERQAYAQITAAQVAMHGTSGYPDAKFTLRLAFGVVKGYREDGQDVPPWTTVGGAFRHEEAHGARPPWRLPSSWHEHRANLDPETPFNFVSTADIIGGNSGSPVINRAGEFVGIIFDGNIQSLTSDFFYSDDVGRAVSVHSSVIPVALRKVYGASSLADELGH